MFGKLIDRQILEYMTPGAPEECCGYINADGEFIRVVNLSKDPENSFECEAPEDALAIVHSHPGGPFYPSETDMRQQLASAKPWGIAAFNERHQEVFWFGDEAPRAPLVGRGFRHGVTDCYELIRDFYLTVHGIELPQFPREWEWWKNGDRSMYMNGFEEAGFYGVSQDEILPGDVFFATVGHHKSRFPNHAGVYLGNGLILHHVSSIHGYDPSRLSTIEPASNYMPFLTKVIRHENSDIDRSIGQKVWPQLSA